MLLGVSQSRRFIAQNDKEIEGFGMFARNLLGTQNLLACCSEFAWKMAWTSHARNSPDKTTC